MDFWKENRQVSFTTGITCAGCGKTTKLNNRFKSEVITFDKNELLFNCPECGITYDLPFKTVEEGENK